MKNPGVLDWIRTHDSSVTRIAYWRSIHSSTGTPFCMETYNGIMLSQIAWVVFLAHHCLFVTEVPHSQLGGLRSRELGQSPILWSLVSLGEFKPNTTISYIAFRYCPELALDIWSISIWQIALRTRLPKVRAAPLGQMAARMGCQMDHRVSADATSQQGVSCSGICHQDILKYHHPRSLDYRPHHARSPKDQTFFQWADTHI